MNKKLATVFALILSVTVLSQVGITTANPTEKLDVNGTTRVRSLPLNGATNAIFTQANGTASITQNQTFTATRTVVADPNGVLGYVSGIASAGPGSSKIIVSASSPGTQNIGSGSGGGNINFTTEHIDLQSAWATNIFTTPQTGIYLIETQIANKHTASGETVVSWYTVGIIQRSTNNGTSWTDLTRDTRSNNSVNDVDNGNSLFWTGTLNAGDLIRIRILCNAATQNTVDLGSLTITQLAQ